MKNHGLGFFKTPVFFFFFATLSKAVSVSLKDKPVRGSQNQPLVYVNLKDF